MPTESNTGSDLGQDRYYGQKHVIVRDSKNKQTRLMVAKETPRDRMARVVRTVQQKRKKGR